MRLVSFKQGGIGAIIGEDVLSLGDGDMTRLLEAGEAGLDEVRRSLEAAASPEATERLRREGRLRPLAQAVLGPPVRPRFIFCMGRAYPSHRQEMMGAARDAAERGDPTGFQQSVHCVIATGEPIRIPPQAPDMVDYEGEVAVVFGRTCHNVRAEDALDYVAGYTVANDVSARNWIQSLPGGSSDVNRMGKQFPTFFPLGPALATKDEFEDPEDLHFVTRVNGEVRQEARTSELVWSIREQIAYFSFWFTFEPGDVLATGTCGGVGFGHKPRTFLKPGDRVTITVDGIGELDNTVTA
jgi:acylpyruvate hydrolase